LPPDSTAPSYAAPDWDAIAHDYAASALTVPELCALHAVSKWSLYYHVNRDGWIKRSALRRAASGASSSKVDAGLRSGKSSKRPSRSRRLTGEAHLARRLLLALDHKMTAFETRMTQAATGDTAATSADSERDARTLGTLVRLFDKLKGFGGKQLAGTDGPAVSRTAGKDIHDADRFRNDLARRLESLRDSIGG
jgi:hypothetical protein